MFTIARELFDQEHITPGHSQIRLSEDKSTIQIIQQVHRGHIGDPFMLKDTEDGWPTIKKELTKDNGQTFTNFYEKLIPYIQSTRLQTYLEMQKDPDIAEAWYCIDERDPEHVYLYALTNPGQENVVMDSLQNCTFDVSFYPQKNRKVLRIDDTKGKTATQRFIMCFSKWVEVTIGEKIDFCGNVHMYFPIQSGYSSIFADIDYSDEEILDIFGTLPVRQFKELSTSLLTEEEPLQISIVKKDDEKALQLTVDKEDFILPSMFSLYQPLQDFTKRFTSTLLLSEKYSQLKAYIELADTSTGNEYFGFIPYSEITDERDFKDFISENGFSITMVLNDFLGTCFVITDPNLSHSFD